MAQYYDIKTDIDQVTLLNNWNGTQTLYNVKNKQLRVDLEGYVWEDIATGKTTTRNDLYDATPDKRIANIPVYLKKNGITIAERKTDTNGRYFFPAKGGYYTETSTKKYEIVIAELSQYSVEFEYNGLKYENVIAKLSNDNGSKASEKPNDRENFHRNFYNITGNTDKNSGNRGKTGTNITLQYTSGDNYDSKLVQNTSYTSDTLQNSVIPPVHAKMLADTKTAGYEIRWNAGVRVIKNINFGMYERAQPDLAVSTDIENIELTINGDYSHKYEYKNRAPYMNSGLPDVDINPGYNAILDGFSVNVKNGNGTYRNCSYVRSIYDSYIAYTKNDPSNNNRLKVYVTYKILVKNESGSLVSRVSLKNYVDTRLDYVESVFVNENGTYSQLNWTRNGGVMQTDLIPKDIPSTECMTIYLKYELNTNTIVSLANLHEQEELHIDRNVTEIASYSTWDKNGNMYGGIDKDSAPNNIVYSDINTYEDDTDAAPDLKFKRKESKAISGLVFEDKTASNELRTGQERKGNGRYEETENKVENVDVQVISYPQNAIAKLYNLDSNGNVVITNAQYLTGKDGRYKVSGLIPGTYYIQYTYGLYNRLDTNNSTRTDVQTKIGSINVTTESYKSTIVDTGRFKTIIDNCIENSAGYSNMTNDYNAHYAAGNAQNALWYWYENPNNLQYSSAVDDYAKRQKINSALSNITYDVKNNYDNAKDDANIHFMNAYTGFLDLAIEDTRVQTTDNTYVEGSRDYTIKFGIVERPRQSLQVYKEISYVRVTLPNGQVLIEGDPRNTVIDYVIYPEGGTLKIEIDNEIIEGATLDVSYVMSVTNKSEVDYNNIKYYRYGDSSGLTPEKMKISALVDYLDEKLSVTHNIGQPNSEIVYYDSSANKIFNKWQLVDKPSSEVNKLAGIPVDSQVYDILKSRRNVLVMNLDKELAINETANMTLNTPQKLLTDLVNKDQLFNNYVEVLGVTNVFGRFYGEMKTDKSWELGTPGNFNVNKTSDTDEADNNKYIRSQLTIVPPTGMNTKITYISIGIICLVILSTGIIFIKKKY